MVRDQNSDDEQQFREFHNCGDDDQTIQALTPPGRESADQIYQEELAPETPDQIRRAQLSGEPASDDKKAMADVPEMSDAELDRLTILPAGTQLEQGSVYLNLAAPERRPFKAIGGQHVGQDDRIIAKKTTDYVLWDKLTGGQETPAIERPD